MRTSSSQTENNSGRERARRGFDYQPDRHYVLAQIPDSHWDGGGSQVPTTPDQFLNIYDEVGGDFAYKLEADGSNPEGLKITNSSRVVLLSCSKEYSERTTREQEEASRWAMRRPGERLRLKMGQEIEETLQNGNPVALTTAFRKADAAKAEREALKTTPG